ncbi:MAG: hypothetical protein JWR80_6014 [Bradyrhizobium sp.]|nr:hypothetical protein [Bradyrhizobium sp.]
MTYAIVVDWYGPYTSIKSAKAAVRKHAFAEVLYMAVGSIDRQKTAHLQYVGITLDFTVRLSTTHTIRQYVMEEGLSLHLGVVSSHAIAGRRASYQNKKHSRPVYLAESVIAFFLSLPLNRNKRCSPPKDSVTLINRWWKINEEEEVRKWRRPHPEWPDYIEYDQHSDAGLVAWHGKRRKHFSADAIRAMATRASAELARRI